MVDFSLSRRDMVDRYKRGGYIQTRRMEEAVLAVPREEFMESKYREHLSRG